MQACQELWSTAQALLRQRVDADTYERYFAEIVPVAFDEGSQTLTLGVSNDLVAFWLSDNYEDVIRTALGEIATSPVTVQLESGHRAAPRPAVTAAATPAVASPAPARDKELGEPPEWKYRPDFTFDTFVVGANNKICVAAARAVAESPGRSYNPLLIYGGVALGKTHLLQAIANEVACRRKRPRIEYVTSEEFVNLYVEALQAKKLPSFRRHFRSLDMLLIDDIQFFEGKVGSCEEFFHTFNTLHNAHKQIVLASDRMPQEIAGLEQRLVTRFEWGLAAEMLPPDLETRVAILKKKQEKQNIRLSDEVLFMVASRIQSNIRSLESALTRLTMNVSAFPEELTVQRAEELLRDRFDQEKTRAVTIDAIQRRVSEHFDISRADLMSKKRPRNIATPRMVAMYLARRLTGQSLPAIGDAFNRNHATVIHAVNQVEQLMSADDGMRNSVELLVRQLNG
jgi:chromosomal replication initiator protein